jgi:hypothetical protein
MTPGRPPEDRHPAAWPSSWNDADTTSMTKVASMKPGE